MLKKNLNFNIFVYLKYTFVYFLIAYTLKNIFLHFQKTGVPIQNNIFEILILKNTGAAFSILKEGKTFLIIFALFILGGIFYYVYKNHKNLKFIDIQSLSFLSAGILSNTFERIIDGFVTDYFKLVFINFPVFNLADLFINIGVILFVFSLLFLDKKEIKQ